MRITEHVRTGSERGPLSIYFHIPILQCHMHVSLNDSLVTCLLKELPFISKKHFFPDTHAHKLAQTMVTGKTALIYKSL